MAENKHNSEIDDRKAILEKHIKYYMEKDGISRVEAIKVVRRVYLLAYVSTLDEKDRPDALHAIDEVGGL